MLFDRVSDPLCWLQFGHFDGAQFHNLGDDFFFDKLLLNHVFLFNFLDSLEKQAWIHIAFVVRNMLFHIWETFPSRSYHSNFNLLCDVDGVGAVLRIISHLSLLGLGMCRAAPHGCLRDHNIDVQQLFLRGKSVVSIKFLCLVRYTKHFFNDKYKLTFHSRCIVFRYKLEP